MNKRQENLFLNIIDEYTNTALPVGSRLLVDKFEMGVSSATIRNDMAELEKEGLIYQPHTSAGRIPTQAGYKYYIENYLREKKLTNRDKQVLDKAAEEFDRSRESGNIKNIARSIAEVAKTAVVVGFSKDDVYYTGISYLLSQPEFADLDVIYDLSNIVDRMDVIMEKIYDKINETEISVADENHFSNKCSSVLTKAGDVLFGIVGPMRMDYGRNLGLVNYSRGLIG